MNLVLVTLLIVSCGTWRAKCQQFIPYSRACRTFEQSREYCEPRCQANFWFFTCLYSYNCNDNGDVEYYDCRKLDSYCEYPHCKDLYCVRSWEDNEDMIKRLRTTTAKSTTSMVEIFDWDDSWEFE